MVEELDANADYGLMIIILEVNKSKLPLSYMFGATCRATCLE